MSNVEVDWLGDQFQVKFKYDPLVVAAVKELPGRRWDPDGKVWFVKDSPQFRSFVVSHDAVVSVDAGAAMATSKQSLGSVRQHGPRLILDSKYDARLVEAIRTVEGRKWDKDHKRWQFPLSSVRSVKAIVDQFDLDWLVDDSVPDADPVTVPIVKAKGDQFLVYTTYDRDVLDAIKEMPGAEWDRWETAFRVPVECVVEIDEFVHRFAGVLDETAQKVVQQAGEVLTMFKASSATSAQVEINGFGGDLMPFQGAGVLYALSALGYQSEADALVRK
jgi:hypothetical protein